MRYAMRFVGVFALALLLATQATAVVWDNGGADQNWSTALNWDTDTVPIATDTATFDDTTDGGAAGTVTNVVDAGFAGTIGALSYTMRSGAETSFFQTTEIAAGKTLLVTGNLGVAPDEFSMGGNRFVDVTITGGAGSKLQVGNTGTFTANVTIANNTGTTGVTLTGNLNMSGLETFEANVNTFNLANGVRQATGTVTLATNNTINANTITLSRATGNNVGTPAVLELGQTNVLNATTINVAERKSRANLLFQSGLAPDPTVTIRGKTGGTSRANLNVGYQSDGGSGTQVYGTADFTGGILDAMIGNLSIGERVSGSGGGDADGTFKMAAGTLDATTIEIGQSNNSSNTGGTAIGRFELQGGDVDAGSVVIAGQTGNGPATGILTITGGTFDVTGSFSDGGGTSTVNLDNGDMTVGNGFSVDNLRVGLAQQTGAEANLTVNGGAVAIGDSGTGSLDVGIRTSALVSTATDSVGVLDLGSSTAVTIDVSQVRIGTIIGAPSGEGKVRGDLILSQSGNNTITAGSILAGDSSTRGNQILSTIQLGGADNTINTDTLTLGGRKSQATMTMAAGGTLDLQGKTTATTNVNLGVSVDGTGTTSIGTLDTTGGTLDAEIGTLQMGKQNTGGGSATGTLSFDDGTVNVNTITMATGDRSYATINQRGGTLAVSGSITDGTGTSTMNVDGTASLTVGGTMSVDTLAIGRAGQVGSLDTSGGPNFNLTVGNLLLGQTTSTAARGTLTLAPTSSIAATNITMSDSTSAGQSSTPSRIVLGSTSNDIDVDTFIISGRKGYGTVEFSAGGGTLDLAGRSGARADLFIGRNNVGTSSVSTGILDLSNGTTFTAMLGSVVLGQKSAGSNGSAKGEIILAQTTNTIDANTILMSDSVNDPVSDANRSRIELNGTTQLDVGTMTIAGRKGRAIVEFGTGGGTLNLGTSGDRVDNLRIGYNSTNTGTHSIGHLDGIGGTINAFVDQMVLGYHQQGTGQGTGELTLTAGTFDVSDIVMGSVGGSGNTATGIVNLQGTATLTAGTISEGAGTADFNFTGGTLHVGTFGFDLVQDGGTLAPGNSPGTTTVNGDYTMNAGDLEIEIEGNTPGSGYDQLIVNGEVDLAGDLSVLVGGYSTTANDLFWILLNDGTDPITGEFASFPEKEAVTIDGRNFYVYYDADFDTLALSGGNDVLLTSVPEPSTVAMLLGLAAVGLLGYLRRKRQA